MNEWMNERIKKIEKKNEKKMNEKKGIDIAVKRYVPVCLLVSFLSTNININVSFLSITLSIRFYAEGR